MISNQQLGLWELIGTPPQHCGHHPPPCGYSDKPRFSAASFPGCLARCLFGHTVDVLQEAGEVKTGVALPNPKRISVAPATARLQVWAYEVFLDFFRVYFCTTILARAIGFGFGSVTTQVLQCEPIFVQCPGSRERERGKMLTGADPLKISLHLCILPRRTTCLLC